MPLPSMSSTLVFSHFLLYPAQHKPKYKMLVKESDNFFGENVLFLFQVKMTVDHNFNKKRQRHRNFVHRGRNNNRHNLHKTYAVWKHVFSFFTSIIINALHSQRTTSDVPVLNQIKYYKRQMQKNENFSLHTEAFQT